MEISGVFHRDSGDARRSHGRFKEFQERLRGSLGRFIESDGVLGAVFGAFVRDPEDFRRVEGSL